jgi:hypothetical protein
MSTLHSLDAYNVNAKKLTSGQVHVIRANVKGKTLDQLAKSYGVHRNTIHRIWQRKTWSNV